jgi:hypothetical protein
MYTLAITVAPADAPAAAAAFAAAAASAALADSTSPLLSALAAFASATGTTVADQTSALGSFLALGPIVCDADTFESGSLASGMGGAWSASAGVEVVRTTRNARGTTQLPLAGTFMARLTAGPSPGVYTTLSFSFEAPAHTLVSTDIMWLGMDELPFNDSASIVDVRLVSGGAAVETPLLAASIEQYGNYRESPWLALSATLPVAGPHVLTYRTTNGLDGNESSQLLLDNVNVCRDPISLTPSTTMTTV